MFIAAACLIQSGLGATITSWNFNSSPPDASQTTGTLSPATGSGIASAIGTVSSGFSTAHDPGSTNSSDPATSTDDSAFALASFPAQGSGDLTSGVRFMVSTAGYADISLTFDIRHSTTSSRYEAVQYTLDGSIWSSLAFFSGQATDTTWFNHRNVDFSAISGADNNPNFGVRIVAAFESTATGSGANQFIPTSSGSYSTAGTWRFDMVSLSGSVIPEPSQALAGLLLASGLLRRRRSLREEAV